MAEAVSLGNRELLRLVLAARNAQARATVASSLPAAFAALEAVHSSAPAPTAPSCTLSHARVRSCDAAAQLCRRDALVRATRLDRPVCARACLGRRRGGLLGHCVSVRVRGLAAHRRC
jgi:hypothetical protein